jgi:pyruvate dehydrogenase E2 component (dihydrolipoamide acetyltransferase)
MLDVDQFNAVLNLPRVAILAVGAIKEIAAVLEGRLAAVPMMQMTLTCDHRAVDGAEGARFLGTLRKLLEEPPT